jgi:site-specific DNA-cytosine methylase
MRVPMKKGSLVLFCGAGGLSMGFKDQGFAVTGIDVIPQVKLSFI